MRGPGVVWRAVGNGSRAVGACHVYAVFALVFDLLSYFQYLDLTLKIIHTMNNKR